MARLAGRRQVPRRGGWRTEALAATLWVVPGLLIMAAIVLLVAT